MSKNYRVTRNPRLLLFAAALAVVSTVSAADTRNITTMALVRDMGLGINLGNTFESNGSWINGSTVEAYETAWGSPVITKPMIDGYAAAGFKTVRVPVAWSNLMTGNSNGGNYTVSPALLARVAEVVNYVLDNDMYAIVNIHQDGGWWKNFPTDSAECMRKYKSIWTQISNHFKDYSDYLVFESLNEEGVWNDVWYIWGDNSDNMTAKARAYGILNTINQTFTDLVRASGGNNGERHLLIAGYETNIDRTIDNMFKMPTDPKNRCAVSVHYYDPFGFTHSDGTSGWSWAGTDMTWGTDKERGSLNNEMDKLKTAFVDKGIPVIIGEYGFACSALPREQSEIRKYTLAVAEAIYSRNMCPVLWDVQLKTDGTETLYYYNRKTASFVDPALVTGFKAIAPTTAVRDKFSGGKAAVQRPSVAVRGRTLSVSSFDTDVNVRMIDVKGKVRARFRASGSESFSVDKIPAGRYLIEVRGAGIGKVTSAVIVR
jgi:endoglucanase